MEQSKEKNAPWLSVPQFGDWDQKGQLPDYSLDFTKIREMRKQNKTNVSRASLGNEEELMASTTNNINTGHSEPQHTLYHQTNSPSVRLLASFVILYFVCYYLEQLKNTAIIYAKNLLFITEYGGVVNIVIYLSSCC